MIIKDVNSKVTTAQYSGEKQGDSTDDVYGSKSEKKESARTSVEAMTLCAAAAML